MGSRGRWRWSGEVGTDLPAPLSDRRSMGQSGASSLSLETQAKTHRPGISPHSSHSSDS